MEQFTFPIVLIIFTLLSISYLHQFYKIVYSRSSIGVSFQAYIVTLIAASSMVLNADEKTVIFLGLIEVILASLVTFVIHKYSSKSESYNINFFVALSASFFMIHGVMQTIKNYTHKEISNVSISSYLIWIMMDLLIIYLATDIKVIIALSISILLYFYIIIDTQIKNKKYFKIVLQERSIK